MSELENNTNNTNVDANNSNASSAQVETYADDMARAIEGTEGGFIKKIIHEQEVNDQRKKLFSFKSKTNKIFVLVGFILIVIAVVIIFVTIAFRKASVVEVPKQFVPIIFAEKDLTLELGDLYKDKMIQIIDSEVKNVDVKKGGVENIYFTENQKPIGLRRFLALLESNVILLDKAVVGENFLAGVVNGDSKSFFLLINVRSMNDVFDNFRSWERKMFSDLHGLFGIDINSNTKEFLTKDFEDGIVQNKNARVLKDKDGKIVMMYVFVTDNYLLITNTEEATHEIILRLISGKVKK